MKKLKLILPVLMFTVSCVSVGGVLAADPPLTTLSVSLHTIIVRTDSELAVTIHKMSGKVITLYMQPSATVGEVLHRFTTEEINKKYNIYFPCGLSLKERGETLLNENQKLIELIKRGKINLNLYVVHLAEDSKSLRKKLKEDPKLKNKIFSYVVSAYKKDNNGALFEEVSIDEDHIKLITAQRSEIILANLNKDGSITINI